MLAPQNTSQPMNRAMKRQMEKMKKHKKPRMFAADGPMVLLNNSSPYEQEEISRDLIRIRCAFERIRDGEADTEDFNRVSTAINLAKIRALEISELLADVIERGQDAMTRCQERYRKTGRWGFDGPGLQEVVISLEAHEEILSKSSPNQMTRAMYLLRDILDKQIANAATDQRATPLVMPK